MHWVATKHTLRYLRGTIQYGLRYASNGECHLHGFNDADSAGSFDDRKSTSRFCLDWALLRFHGLVESKLLFL